MNESGLRANSVGYRTNVAILRNNAIVLSYLQAHPGTPDAELPGVLNTSDYHNPAVSTAWQAAQQSQLVRYLPSQLVSETTVRDVLLQQTEQSGTITTTASCGSGDL